MSMSLRDDYTKAGFGLQLVAGSHLALPVIDFTVTRKALKAADGKAA